MFLELMASQTSMELNQVEIIGLHPAKALFHTGPHISCRVNMLGSHRGPRHTPTFGGEKVLPANASATSGSLVDDFTASGRPAEYPRCFGATARNPACEGAQLIAP